MFGFLFKSATYYILWQKFQKQIVMIILSVILIAITLGVYDDLFKVLKVSNKDSLVVLLLAKWFIISFIIGFNIYKLKQIKIDKDDTEELFNHKEENITKNYPVKTQDVLKKKTLKTTTDIILEKYIND